MASNVFNLKDKVAVITGAAGGLGAAMASALSKQGAKIAILDMKNGSQLAKKLKTKSQFYKLDVTNEENIKQVLKKIKKEFGSIDILINNAGLFYPTPILDTEQDKWDKLMQVNVRGYFLMTKHAVPIMKKGGKIINIASVAGHHAFASSCAYNASKGAVIQMTKTMAIEFANKDITANAICPGVFETPMTKDLLKSRDMQKMIKSSILKGRPAKADELAGLAVYLASHSSNYMTGSIITIDGGWTCHL
ncbi:MAG: SDR family NAD(P)-dependent oxidoreductase [Candidatus Nanoarchaeia archaeon]